MNARVKCLLVDDIEENLLVLSEVLRREDVELLLARSGREALELLLEHEVALAFLDVQMPEMDGFELAELMRGNERTRHIPIIFLTAAYEDQRRVFAGYERGAVDFLHKPIDPHVLRGKADVFFDLHRQQRRLSDELRDRTEMLRLSETFVAVLGHDLRNPLNAIVTSAYLLEKHTDDAFVRDIGARIASSGMRMNRMIEDLLDVARARLGQGIPVTPGDADLEPLLDRVVQEYRVAFPGRAIEVERTGPLTGRWDADRLAQATANLLGNALQHGRDDAAVLVRLDGTVPDVVRVSVTNAGGIAPEVMPHLFNPFSGARRSGRHSGLGLGLYIADQIVRAHDGTLHVEPDGEDRTTFVVTVPRRAPEVVGV